MVAWSTDLQQLAALGIHLDDLPTDRAGGEEVTISGRGRWFRLRSAALLESFFQSPRCPYERLAAQPTGDLAVYLAGLSIPPIVIGEQLPESPAALVTAALCYGFGGLSDLPPGLGRFAGELPQLRHVVNRFV